MLATSHTFLYHWLDTMDIGFKKKEKLSMSETTKVFGLATFCFLSLLLSMSSAFAANYYISSTAQGSHDCSSWANACTPADISFGGAHYSLVVDGAKFYFDGGPSGMTYNSPYINFQMDGSRWATGVTLATGAKSPSPSGHDGYVTFDGQGTSTGFIYIGNCSHVTIDGEKNGTINWKFYNALTHDSDPGRYYYAVRVIDSGSGRTKAAKVSYIWVDTVGSGVSVLYMDGVEISYSKFTNIYHETAIDARGLRAAALGTNKIHHNQIENAADPVAWSSGGAHGGCRSATNYGPDAIQASSDVDIYNNTFTTRVGNTFHCQHPDFIQADWVRVRVYNNLFRSGLSLIQNSHERTANIPTVEDFWFYNNVAIGLANGIQALIGAYNTTSITRVYVFNNTLLDFATGSGLTIPSQTATIGDIQVRNNIFRNAMWNESELSDAQCARIVYSNNVVNGKTLTCNRKPVTNTNGQTGIPSFVNYRVGDDSSDVQLAAGDTVARDRGVDLSSVQSAFTTDKNGVSRPQGSAWDIGAYCYGSAGGLSSPNNLRVLIP